MFCVYVLVFSNGKRYVGLTDSPERRHRMHTERSSQGGNFAVGAAVRRYGMPEMWVLRWVSTVEKAKDYECDRISFYVSNDNRYGYNLTSGGDRGPDHWKPEQKLRHSTIIKNSWTPEMRAARAAATRAKWADPEYRAKQKVTWQNGRTWSTPEGRTTATKKVKLNWQTKERRLKHNTPDSLARFAASMRLKWQDPEFRARRPKKYKRQGGTHGQ